MGTLLAKMPPQTLYVTITREELRRLREERDRLQQQVATLSQQLEQAKSDGKNALV
ncbi:DUF6026 family protein [Pseudomonas sp. GD03860]|uniref:DUF6026 family protein n=1 Tax=Pseudomonas TaxID=286 RepID=UPI0023646226|nr:MULTISPECIES: DUF6026 family protein [Pseudomonas]MDD2058833.1 DUF6026 family protein [Pseudomonas putida]MDH0639953.1 DUF6026 family protein [Pseudomonas sp. GD03860]